MQPNYKCKGFQKIERKNRAFNILKSQISNQFTVIWILEADYILPKALRFFKLM